MLKMKLDVHYRRIGIIDSILKQLKERPGDTQLLKDLRMARMDAIPETIADQQDILEELRPLGFKGRSIGVLVMEAKPYPQFLPVLRRHLKCEHLPNTYESIARALTVHDAKTEEFDALYEFFTSVPDEVVLPYEAPQMAVEAAGNALGYIASTQKDPFMVHRLLARANSRPDLPIYGLMMMQLARNAGQLKGEEVLTTIKRLEARTPGKDSAILAEARKKAEKALARKAAPRTAATTKRGSKSA
jgi:hypothetical protein